MTFKSNLLIILADNIVNKVHRKFPLDMSYLFEFFPAIRCYYSHWFLFYFKSKLGTGVLLKK